MDPRRGAPPVDPALARYSMLCLQQQLLSKDYVSLRCDYERTLPVRDGAPTSLNYTSPAAPVYVVNGAAGNREENDRAPGNESWSPAADPTRGIVPLMRDVSYGVVTVTTDSLRFQQFFSSNGTAFDTFTITKPHQRRMLEL